MELVLADLQWTSCLIYLDDIIIFGRTFEEHLGRLQAVLVKLKEANLKVKPSKCHTLCVENGVLWSQQRGVGSVDVCRRVVVPRELVPELLQLLHNSKTGGHLGIAKLKDKIRTRFYWPKWSSDVMDWCKKCELCAVFKTSGAEPRAPLRPIQAGYPFEKLGIDIVGPLPVTSQGNKYIIVIADYFTKWCEAFAMRAQDADTVARTVVEQFILRWGTPRSIHTDQGKNFDSALFRAICELLDIHKTRTTPYHPSSDGLVERLNRTITTMLSMFVDANQGNWDELLPYVMMAYRSSVQTSTKFSPFCAVFGREIVMPADLLFNVEVAKSYSSVGGYVEEKKVTQKETGSFSLKLCSDWSILFTVCNPEFRHSDETETKGLFVSDSSADAHRDRTAFMLKSYAKVRSVCDCKITHL
uniref:Gypsy retrotransposon integrase-like protein 1 n=1 Tax=Astyanax mexicanus TaxID=7994 RepID=A0A3B1JN79_ASTMX